MTKIVNFYILSFVLLICESIVTADQPTTQPSVTPKEQVKVQAKVLKVVGRVQHSPLDQNKWVDTHEGDVLNEGVRIRTGFKSAVQLQLHTAAIVQVQSASQVALVELAEMGNTEKTRISLKYGKIRGGILQEKVNSDFQIVCPAAVLTREGTWGFEMSYDPATGNYRVGLDTDGLVRVLNTVTGKRVGIVPGQFVTQSMQEWFKTAEFDRMVDLIDQFGITQVEKTFYAINPGGRTAADPTGTTFAANFNESIQTLSQTIAERFKEGLQQKKQEDATNNLVEAISARSNASSARPAAKISFHR